MRIFETSKKTEKKKYPHTHHQDSTVNTLLNWFHSITKPGHLNSFSAIPEMNSQSFPKHFTMVFKTYLGNLNIKGNKLSGKVVALLRVFNF